MKEFRITAGAVLPEKPADSGKKPDESPYRPPFSPFAEKHAAAFQREMNIHASV